MTFSVSSLFFCFCFLCGIFAFAVNKAECGKMLTVVRI